MSLMNMVLFEGLKIALKIKSKMVLEMVEDHLEDV